MPSLRSNLLEPLSHPVDPDSVYDDPETYFSRHDQGTRIAEYRELTRELKLRAGTEQPQVLDVGSGRGDFVHSANLEGVSAVTGVEFAAAMVSHAREHFGVELFHGTVEALAREWDGPPFDAVVLNAILEHVSDPDSFVRALADLTSEGSLLYLDIPREPHLAASLGNAINRIRRRPDVFNISPTWPPFHVFGFSEEALRRLLAKHGFRVEELRVWCDPVIFSDSSRRDALAARAGTLVNQIANLTRTAGNMFVWARHV